MVCCSCAAGDNASQDEFMQKDECLLVDSADIITGTSNKHSCHQFIPSQPTGVLHRAFSVFLFDSQVRSFARFYWPPGSLCLCLQWGQQCRQPSTALARHFACRSLVKTAYVHTCLHRGGYCCSSAPRARSHSPQCGPTPAAATPFKDRSLLRWTCPTMWLTAQYPVCIGEGCMLG